MSYLTKKALIKFVCVVSYHLTQSGLKWTNRTRARLFPRNIVRHTLTLDIYKSRFGVTDFPCISPFTALS